MNSNYTFFISNSQSIAVSFMQFLSLIVSNSQLLSSDSISYSVFGEGLPLYIIMVNSLGLLESFHERISNTLIQTLFEILDNNVLSLFLAILITSIMILMLIVDVIFRIHYDAYFTKIISLFLDIKHSSINSNINYCQQFVQALQTKQITQLRFDKAEETEDEEFLFMSRKRKETNATKLKLPIPHFLLCTFLFAILLLIYWY